MRSVDALRNLGSALRVASEGSVRIGEREVPMPDVLSFGRCIAALALCLSSMFRLVIEVSDTTIEDDLGRKRRVYAEGGVPEYWVVDLPGRVVRQYWVPLDGFYASEKLLPFGERLLAAMLPDLGIDTICIAG